MSSNSGILSEAAKLYRLEAPSVSNAILAGKLNMMNGRSVVRGQAPCFFFKDGSVVAIRLKPDLMAVFTVFESMHRKVAEIAEEVDWGETDCP